MAELLMRKRAAMHAGEIGLFIDSQIFESELANIHQGTDITVEATQSRNPRQFRLFWGLAGKIEESGVMGDADKRDVVDYLLMKCKHVRYITTELRDGVTETIPVPKSIRFASMDQTAFNRLFQRALYIVTTQIFPYISEGQLRDEIEKMSGVNTPELVKPKRKRGRPPLPKPVSIIPPDESPKAGDTPAPPPASPAPSNSPAATGKEMAQASHLQKRNHGV